jgi:hypothetical protein
MTSSPEVTTYKVLASDKLLYGPIDLPTLIQWTMDERVLPETWVFRAPDNKWIPADFVSDLKPYFQASSSRIKLVDAVKATGQVQPEELRQFPIFSGVTNEQLAQFLEFAEFLSCDTNHLLIKKGAIGDAIFFLLSGSVRARIVIAHEEKILTTIPAGEFFGEIAMFTQSARSADIVVAEPSRLLRVSAQSFLNMSESLPTLACPILCEMSRWLAVRVADLTVQLSRSQAAEHVWS